MIVSSIRFRLLPSPAVLVAWPLQSRYLHASTFAGQKTPDVQRPRLSASTIFEDVLKEEKEEKTKTKKKEYRFSSANFKISPRKLNMLAKQIRGLKVKDAIVQMEFSPKRAATKVLKNLVFAKKNASTQEIYNMDPERMVVSQAFVGKGLYLKRVMPHARGRAGVMHHPSAHIKFIFTEDLPKPDGKDPKGQERAVRRWKKTRKPWVPLVEDKPIYNADPRMYDRW